jgi:hypothetical protein
MAVQNYQWNYVPRDTGDAVGVEPRQRREEPQVNEILAASGLEVVEDILMDKSHFAIGVPSRRVGPFVMPGMPLELPMHIKVAHDSMNLGLSITSRLDELYCLWGSRIKLDADKLEENKLKTTVLFSTSEGAWTVPGDVFLDQAHVTPPEETQSYPMGVLVEGQFADAFPGPDRPKWPTRPPSFPGAPPPPPRDPGTEVAPPATPAPGKLVLLGCAELFNNFALRDKPHRDLLLGSLEALTVEEDLLGVRTKRPVARTFTVESAVERTVWKVLILAGMNTVVAVAGILRAILVRAARENYRAERDTGL